jgi:hypothetical protein
MCVKGYPRGAKTPSASRHFREEAKMMHEGYKTSWVMKIVSAFIAPVLFVTFPGFVAMAAKPPEEPLLRLERGAAT